MSGRKLIVVAASVATLMSVAVVTAPLADAKPKAPSKVSKVRLGAVSTNAASLSWKNPKSKNFKSTVVRIAAGTKAPKSAKAGRGIATVSKKKHAVSITRLAPGTVYTVGLFTTDGKKHFSKVVAVHLRTTVPRKPPAPPAPPAPTTGSVSGVVFGGDTNTRLRNVQVTAYPDKGAVNLLSVTSADGSYSFPTLAPDSYSVCFDASNALGGAAPLGYDSDCLNNGDDFAVAAGDVLNRPITLQKSARLSGTVTGGGDALSEVELTIYNASGDEIDETNTDEDGFYQFTYPVGAVKICYDGRNAEGGTSATGYASDCQQPISVAAGEDKTLNFALATAAGITGKVLGNRGADTVALADVDVYAIDASSDPDNREYGYGTSGSGGTYTVGSLAAGSYYLCFDASSVDPTNSGVPTGFISACKTASGVVNWSGDPNDLPGGLSSVTVTTGQLGTTSNTTLQRGGAITGTVKNAAAAAISTYVEVFDADGVFVAGVTNDADDGSYAVPGLPAGSYFLCFDSNDQEGLGYASECYADQPWSGDDSDLPDLDTLTSVPVTAGVSTSRNAVLAQGGAISGKVLAGGTGVDFRIRVYDQDDNQIAASNLQASSDGSYTFGGLRSGTYHVCFASRDDDEAYGAQCYKNVAWQEYDDVPTGVTDVVVTTGVIKSGVDADLPHV